MGKDLHQASMQDIVIGNSHAVGQLILGSGNRK
jgi:hypothetical protein